MLFVLQNILSLNLDAPTLLEIYIQDSVTPQMEGFFKLYDNIMYYLVVKLFAVPFVLFIIIVHVIELMACNKVIPKPHK